MAKLNTSPPRVPARRTHEGAVAARITPLQELRRTVMACLLWEDTFYESGEDIATRIAGLVNKCTPEQTAALAFEARTDMNLRHVPLLLMRNLARLGSLKAEWLSQVIQRADELTEFLAIYWKDGKQPLSAQVKKGLALAFPRFSAYSLAKYNRDGKVKLRDVLFLSHAKPMHDKQAAEWKALIDGALPAPDTWEVALSAGADKKETFTRLIREDKLGALALLRNLRNMEQAGVDPQVIRGALKAADASRVLPFRFLTAAKAAPRFEPELEDAMFRACTTGPKLAGKTVLLVDMSGSMYGTMVSAKSDVDRADAACAIAAIAREMCETVEVFGFADDTVRVPARRGFALMEAIKASTEGGTYLARAIDVANKEGYDRLLVITDEQSHDGGGTPLRGTKAYTINVGSYRNGVNYGNGWTHISGFSDAVLKYIDAIESDLK